MKSAILSSPVYSPISIAFTKYVGETSKTEYTEDELNNLRAKGMKLLKHNCRNGNIIPLEI